MVTDVPVDPDVGEMLVILGAATTVKLLPLLATPETVTTMLPVVAPVGTVATMLVALQFVAVAAVPLNLTVLDPWLAPKLVPVMVTEAPIAPEVGDRLVMLGVGRTVKLLPLLSTPLAWTTTLPVLAPAGTGTFMLVALQLVGVAVVPLNLTVLLPWVVPKFVPVIVIEVPTVPEAGERLVMLGAGTTVKALPLLATPDTVTTTFPVVAPAGTVATMLVAPQLVAVAVVPLNLTVLVPWVAPKLVPVMVTDAPTAPELGDKLLMLGVGITVKLLPLLSTPLAWTTTFPVVAAAGTGTLMEVPLHEVGVAVVPLNLTVLLPWVAPKFVPVMVTDVPAGPEVGERLVMLGAATTVKLFPLLATPDTVTTTFPVVAPAGTVAVILLALQLVAVAPVPLNLTVLVPWVVPNPLPAMVIDAPTAPVLGVRLVMLGAAKAAIEKDRNSTLKTARRIILPFLIHSRDFNSQRLILKTSGVPFTAKPSSYCG
jgi:hypothetical protein